MEAGIEQHRENEEAGRRHQDQIEHVERERREGRAKLQEGTFERGMKREERVREMTAPNIEKMMAGWSASREEGGRREPGMAGYAKVEEAIATDKTAGESAVAKYQAEADKAAKDVADKREAQKIAEEDAKRFRQAASINRGHATGIEQKLSDDTASQESGWLYGTNWLKSVGRFGTRNNANSDAKAREKLEGSLSLAQQLAMGAEKQAGAKDSTAQAAAQATEDALKTQQQLVEKTAAEKEAQAQRDIKNAEAYIAKLKEMHEAHLKNAEAIEKAGRALTVQLALEKPHARHKLERAIERAKTGKATMKDYALLARNASPEKAEEFEKKGLATLSPEQRRRFEGTAEFLGKGKSAVNAEKAKAANEEKKIKQQEEYVGGAKQAALKASDTMTSKLASILKELFGAQEARFAEALNRIHSDMINQSHGHKTLSE
jgi:hypothetical protein